MTLPPRVFTIPPGVDFLDTLSAALLDGRLIPGFSPGTDPLRLASVTILVPTRRAARALAGALAARVEGPSALLPRILPLGAMDSIETDLAFDETGLDDPLSEDLPEANGPIARRMILMRLILQWSQAVRRAIVSVGPDGARELHPHEDLLVAASPADAWSLAGDLATLSDELAAAEVPWERIAPLGTDAYDRYWRITLDFLAIVVEAWPAILAERGEVDAVRRQTALIDAEIRRLERGGAGGPVIVAGSTGTNPATARLIAAIARLPQGAVVLPGLDQGLDTGGWAAVAGEADDAATHPQATLKRLLATLGVDREAVRMLGEPAAALDRRCRFVSEALRPARTTDVWRAVAASGALDPETALAGVAVLEAANEREEALAIAIALREALEGAGSAVLVTPDRTLGRRVREELTRWSIDIDESSGEPLGTTQAGAFARLVLDSAVQDLAPVEILAVLAHPLARFGRTRAEVTALARTLEAAILRGTLPPRGLHDPEGLVSRARASRNQAARRLSEGEASALAAFAGEVADALAPLTSLPPGTPLPEWLATHAAVLDAITTTPEGGTALSGLDGHALVALFEALAEAPEPAVTLDAAGYAALFDRLAAETPVRGPNRSHPRLKILGLLEARLLSADLVVLGGLDEGVWPPQSRTDAFLNRPMRASLGLPSPDRRIGQTAHDLSMLMGAPRVILSRAVKRGGTPTVPSRFLLRMAALAGDAWTAARARGAAYAALALAIDEPAAHRGIPRPNPKPPLDLRPTRLSVTRIEVLRRDPYAIYAEHVLKLASAEPIGAPLGPADYGTLFHSLIAQFARRHPAGPLPSGAAETFLAEAETVFADSLTAPTFRAFVWPRIAGWARAYLAWEGKRRALGFAAPLIEERGALGLRLLDGSDFLLTAHADRIEIGPSGLVTIVDFKTGAAPSVPTVEAGFSPQLTLEAAMAEREAFDKLGPGAKVEGALYLKFETGGGVKATPLVFKTRAFAEVVADHFEGLVALLNQFRDENRGYLARPYPQFVARFGAYDHLARVKEWAAGEDDGGEA